jgi:NDP-sugar pyrophosphorylase family protein
VGEGAFLKNTVVWDRAVIAPGVELEDCIVACRVQVQHSARGQVLVT